MGFVTAFAERPASVTPATPLKTPTILVFDSGLGGLSVFREIARARPDANFVYAADDAAFPYGNLSDEALVARVGEVMEHLIAQMAPDLVVIACNTASTVVLPSLRARHPIPFVGTVPAVKPACAASVSRRVSILATPGTVHRDYTTELVRSFAEDCHVDLVGSVRLAAMAEAILRGEAVDDADLLAEIAPCFVEEGGARTDTVVLACTHYPLIVDRLACVAPWPVSFMDPAPAIARRVTSLLGPAEGTGEGEPVRLLSTGRPLEPARIGAIIGRPVAAPDLIGASLLPAC